MANAHTNELFDRLHNELREVARIYMSREESGHILQPTAVVHEVYLKLVGWGFKDSDHCRCTAARAIKQVLVDEARRENRKKRGSDFERVQNVPLDEFESPQNGAFDSATEILAVNDLIEELKSHSPKKADAVLLHFFGKCTKVETARQLGISEPTVRKYLDEAIKWLRREYIAQGFV